jgi:hypothetical protein
MDGRLRAKVKTLTMELARGEQARLRGAGTMIELEELACEIGDEITTQLMSLELADRCNEAAELATSACPDCGDCCGQGDPKSRQLTGVRGEVNYREPTFYCPACRRSFFPGSGQRRTLSAGDSDSKVAAEDNLGRSQSK